MEQYHKAGQIGPYGIGWDAEEDEHGGRTISGYDFAGDCDDSLGERSFYRINKSKKGITTGKLIFSSVGRLLSVLILLFLSPLTTIIGAGRVLPWFGIWTTMP